MSSTPPSKSALPRALVEAWHADEPSPAELRRGYGRFMRKPAASRPFFRLVSGLALGLVLGVGLAQAASVARSRWVTTHEVVARQTAKRTSPAPAKRHPWQVVPQPPLPLAAEPAPSATPTPPSASVPLTPPSASVPLTPPSASAPPTPARSNPAPLEGSAQLALPSGSSSASSVQQEWQHAAAALRANDFTQAQLALLEVERKAAGSERDAARLARAQLLASHGRAAEAVPLLQELAAHAQSSVVRAQSATLLARLRETDDRDRSSETSPEINR